MVYISCIVSLNFDVTAILLPTRHITIAFWELAATLNYLPLST